MKLSQCMIVKNEEKNIERALSWGQGIVDEQIVVDTGSTDRTVEIATAMGAKVYYFEWIKDFAAAKNYAIEQAKGDWIIFLDADEYFDRETAESIPGLIDEVKDWEGRKSGKKTNVIECCIAHLDGEGGIKVAQKEPKIFRKEPNIRFIGRIHEYVGDITGDELVGADLSRELVIYHTGFAWSEEVEKAKANRNLELLYIEYEKKPDSAVLQLYIAESLAALGKREEAFEYVSKAVRNTDGSLPYDRLLMAYQMRMYEAVGTKKADEATMLETYRESVEFDARWPDFDIAMGYFYYMRDCYAETVEYLERAVAKAGMMNDFVYSRFPEHWKRICGILTVCCSNLKDWVGIVKYGTLYLQEDKNAEGVIVPILNQLVNVEQEPVEAVIGCLRGIYNLEDRKDLFFLIKCVNKAGLLSLEDALKKYLTDEERALIYKE